MKATRDSAVPFSDEQVNAIWEAVAAKRWPKTVARLAREAHTNRTYLGRALGEERHAVGADVRHRLADALGLSLDVLRRTPTRTVPFRAALALETAPDGEGVRPSRILRGRLVYLPVEARANAGPGGGHVEREGYITVPAEWLEGIAGEQVVCVEIGGDCMQHDDPEHSLRDGDVALFDQRLTPRVGDIICITVPDSGDDDGECLVKRVAAIDGESITLVPHLVLPGMPSFQRFRLEAIRLEGVLVGKYEMAGRSRLRRFQPAPRRALPAPENGQIAG